jgi:excisionase family DNA binding protein
MAEITLKSSDLTNVTDAATQLHVSRMTIYRWAKQGKILAVKFSKSTFIPKSEIQRLKERLNKVSK